MDLDLDNDWWIIYARGMDPNAGSLMAHTGQNRWISDTRFNVVDATTVAPPTVGATTVDATTAGATTAGATTAGATTAGATTDGATTDGATTAGATIACATPLLLALFTAIAVVVNRE